MIYTQSVGYVPENGRWPVKRESGENPVRYQSLYAPKFLYPLTQVSHWETEKAGYKNAKPALYGASQKTCFAGVLRMPVLPRCPAVCSGVFVLQFVFCTEKHCCDTSEWYHSFFMFRMLEGAFYGLQAPPDPYDTKL